MQLLFTAPFFSKALQTLRIKSQLYVINVLCHISLWLHTHHTTSGGQLNANGLQLSQWRCSSVLQKELVTTSLLLFIINPWRACEGVVVVCVSLCYPYSGKPSKKVSCQRLQQLQLDTTMKIIILEAKIKMEKNRLMPSFH